MRGPQDRVPRRRPHPGGDPTAERGRQPACSPR
jgi:hypothetical protein